MILGAVIDAGIQVEFLRGELDKLHCDGWTLTAERGVSAGLAGTRAVVRVTRAEPAQRTLGDVTEILEGSGLDAGAKTQAIQVFQRLAEAEGRVHGVAPGEVHFHDVGAIDAIVDVVGAVVGLRALELQRIFVSSLPLGLGQVESAHGLLPLPAPATLELIAAANAPTRPVETDRELVTPTGAAILTTLGEFRQPTMNVSRAGVGLGTRVLPWPNILRLWTGTMSEEDLVTGEITIIEANLDDSSPEQLGFAMERLFAAGALDVFFTPVQMKKNRPGVVLTVLSPTEAAEMLAAVVLRETSSLGVRLRPSHRIMATRRNDSVVTEFGPIQVKVKRLDGQDVVSPEFEDCARVAREQHLPLATIYAAVLRAVGG